MKLRDKVGRKRVEEYYGFFVDNFIFLRYHKERVLVEFVSRFRVFTTEEFDHNYRRLNGSEQNHVDKILELLIEQWRRLGSLFQVFHSREKKFDGNRGW